MFWMYVFQTGGDVEESSTQREYQPAHLPCIRPASQLHTGSPGGI